LRIELSRRKLFELPTIVELAAFISKAQERRKTGAKRNQAGTMTPGTTA
jgi:hypothetical protein